MKHWIHIVISTSAEVHAPCREVLRWHSCLLEPRKQKNKFSILFSETYLMSRNPISFTQSPRTYLRSETMIWHLTKWRGVNAKKFIWTNFYSPYQWAHDDEPETEVLLVHKKRSDCRPFHFDIEINRRFSIFLFSRE